MSTLAPGYGHMTAASVSVARTIEEVEALREFWQANAWHPRMSLEVYLEAHRAPLSVSLPYVVMVSRNAKLEGILAGRLEDARLDVKLGYFSCWKAKLRAISVPNAGVLGDFSVENAQAACCYLLGALQQRQVEAVFFEWLPVESNLFKAVRSSAKVWWQNAALQLNQHWRIRLPPDAAELWGQSHHRRAWVRRIFKKIEADHPAKVNYRFFSDSAEVDTMCRDAEQVAAKSYQRTLGVGFVCDDSSCQRLLHYAKLGILRGCILYVDGVPKAFWIGSVFKGRFFSAYLGHDPGFQKYEPGSLVFIKMLEKLCAEGAHQVDLGQGEGFYKQRFANHCDMEACLYVLSPSLRSLMLNAGFSAGEALAIGAKKALSALNVLQSLKTKWRRRLLRKTANVDLKNNRSSEGGKGIV